MGTTKKPAAKKAAVKKAATPNAGGVAKKNFFYVVYVDAYRNDTTIVPRGIYRTKSKIERFENMADTLVQSFEAKIPDGVLHKLAAELKISVADDAGDYRDSKEILEEMVQELN